MILTQDQFAFALANTANAIRLLDVEGNKLKTISHEQAALCMSTGAYKAVGSGSAKRVRYLQALVKGAIVPRERECIADPSFWDERHLWTWSAADFGRRVAPLACDGLPA